jgi:hypothetical protein
MTQPAPAAESPPTQPAGSKIIFVGDKDSLTFMIPRTGFRGAALVFLIFALFWVSVTFCVVGGFVLSFLHNPSFEDFLVMAFLMIFVAVGVAMGLASIQMAFRRAVILAARDSLVYTQKGPIRNAEFQWKPDQLLSVVSEYSGTKVNDRRMRELQIRDLADNKRGFMDGRDDAELEWMAATLRDFYGLRTTPPAADEQAPPAAEDSVTSPPPA